MKNLLNERKLKVQESLIEDLKEENQRLKKELEDTKANLEFEQTFKDNEFDNLKELIVDLNKKKAIYEDLIQKAKTARNEYKEKSKEMDEIKAKYSKEMKSLMKDIKNDIK